MNINASQVEAAAKAMVEIVGGLAAIATMFLSAQQQGQDASNVIDFKQRHE